MTYYSTSYRKWKAILFKMDIKKSQRLSQYLGLVSDIVQYNDVGTHMIDCGTLSAKEHELLQGKVRSDGNAAAMNEFLTIVNLRRGGFDAFLEALRNTEYVWIAEQLDPGKVLTEPPSFTTTGGHRGAKVQNLIANVRQSINRKSEPVMNERKSGDLTFMSYRGSCPIEIPVNPRYFESIDQKGKAAEIQKLHHKLNEPSLITQDISVQLMNLEMNENGTKSNKIAVVENMPEFLQDSSTTLDYFTKLAQRLHVPSDLKVIHNGKIVKKGRRGKVKNMVKLEFQSEDTRNNFIKAFKEFILNPECSDELYNNAKQLNITTPQIKGVHSKGLFKSRPKKRKEVEPPCAANIATKNAAFCQPELEPSRKHWYQQRFSLKAWRKKKRLNSQASC